jgi:hypothetical protein
MTDVCYTGCRVLADGAWRDGLDVLVTNGRIEAVQPSGCARAAQRIALPPEALLAPGYIDIQVNGGGGVLFNDDPSAAAAPPGYFPPSLPARRKPCARRPLRSLPLSRLDRVCSASISRARF